jgi:uncharacterized protein YyaL (SSP411 family)
VVIAGDGSAEDGSPESAAELQAVATAAFAFNKSTLRLTPNEAVAKNLPPALAATIPNLPQLKSGQSFAVLCSGSACQPPVSDPAELKRQLERALEKKC